MMALSTNTNQHFDWLKDIDNSWTLFLDRDGVINDEIENGYILNWKMFRFLDGVLDSFPVFKLKFSKIVIVTNQKGVGKGLMSMEDLDFIHQNMLIEIMKYGGRVDKIYYCTDIMENSPCRKPNIGMANQAKNDFPMIDFSRSIMVGNSLSDMKFGENTGMRNIFLRSQKNITDLSSVRIDGVMDSLKELAKAL